MHTTRAVLLALVAMTSIPGVTATQSQTPLAFEAASIRRADPGATGTSMNMSPGGYIMFRNTTIRSVISLAYPGLRDIEGAPVWLASERYDVNVTAGREITPVERSAMFQSLLADRVTPSSHCLTS